MALRRGQSVMQAMVVLCAYAVAAGFLSSSASNLAAGFSAPSGISSVRDGYSARLACAVYQSYALRPAKSWDGSAWSEGVLQPSNNRLLSGSREVGCDAEFVGGAVGRVRQYSDFSYVA